MSHLEKPSNRQFFRSLGKMGQSNCRNAEKLRCSWIRQAADTTRHCYFFALSLNFRLELSTVESSDAYSRCPPAWPGDRRLGLPELKSSAKELFLESAFLTDVNLLFDFRDFFGFSLS